MSIITGLDYFYDAQQRRFLEQIVRAFSGFKYRTGYGKDGEAPREIMVPCRMALRSRLIASIIANGSENMLNTCPMITIAQTGLTPRWEDLQNQSHISTVHAVERGIEDGKYTGDRGRGYTVERLMPIPLNMTFQVDIWTSNEDQKYQLSEQILQQVAPSFEIQNSENALDWTSLTVCYLDDIVLSSKSIPIGTSGSDDLDIMTLTFRMPFLLTPPAKVKQQTLIHQVVTNINDMQDQGEGEPPMGERLSQSVVTPGNHRIMINKNKITLLGSNGAEEDDEGNLYHWISLFNIMGVLRPMESIVSIATTGDIEHMDVVGTIQIDPLKPNELFWHIDPDTLPRNTLRPVDAIIEPHRTFPGGDLPVAVIGHRYLLLGDVGPSEAWGNLTAKQGNIIQYTHTGWVVVFDGLESSHEVVVNLNTGSQLRWTGAEWVMSIDGEYTPGLWRLRL